MRLSVKVIVHSARCVTELKLSVYFIRLYSIFGILFEDFGQVNGNFQRTVKLNEACVKVKDKCGIWNEKCYSKGSRTHDL